MPRTSTLDDFSPEPEDEFHNPLFDSMIPDFDQAFLERNASDDHVLKHYYVPVPRNEQLFPILLGTGPANESPVFGESGAGESNEGFVYICFGRKGVGKTLLLKRFCSIAAAPKRAILYLDLRNRKSDKRFIEGLPGTLLERLFSDFKRRNSSYDCYFEDPARIRELDGSYAMVKNDDTLVLHVLNHKQEAVEFFLAWLAENGTDVFLVIDNIDDFPLQSVKQIIDKCFELKNSFGLKCVIALRSYWRRARLRLDDTNYASKDIVQPDIYNVVNARLQSIPVQQFTKHALIRYGENDILLEPGDVIASFNQVVKELAAADTGLHDRLYRLANYNTRDHLRNIYNFLHSPYLFSKPVFLSALASQIRKQKPEPPIEDPRPIQWFDFLDGFMAVHYLWYDRKASNIRNIFHHEWPYERGYNFRNVWILVRIMQCLLPAQRVWTKASVIDSLVAIGYPDEAVRDAIDKLLLDAFIESEEGVREKDVQGLQISAKGLMYLNDLLTEYTYLVLVCDAVPMPEEFKIPIREKFGTSAIPLDRGRLKRKDESVTKFIEFLRAAEEQEARDCNPGSLDVLEVLADGGTSRRIQTAVEDTMNRMKSGDRPDRKSPARITSVQLLDPQ